MSIDETISHYRIEERLGQGAMGVVYQALDTKLDRTVALKFLSTLALPTDDDKARFYREAKAAAKLNHAHIATVYEIDETNDGQAFIAMEYVEGETLAERIKRGPLKLKEAITIAIMIAEGLQAAHGQGIVHRDVKSANVMLDERDQVKVMDFGLARMAGASVLTKEGTAVGTVSYMSPEQSRGEEVDHRSDIWSLGVVLYEMIAGHLPFAGDYEQAVVYAILNGEVEALTAIRTGVPMALERVVAKCLAKDARLRYQHADEVAVDLRAIDLNTAGRSQEALPVAVAARRSRPARWMRALPWSVAALMTVMATITLWSLIQSSSQPSSVEDKPVMRSVLSLPERAPLALFTAAFNPGQPALALSHDGTSLVYVAEQEGSTQLYVRPLDRFEAEPLPGTEGAYFPFFSPDGQWVGFFADNKLKKISLQRGTPITLCEVTNPMGATWRSDGTIFFASEEADKLRSISAEGGTSQIVATRGKYAWPVLLPSENAMLVTNQYAESISSFSLESGEKTMLLVNGTNPRYVPTGHLVYARKGRLMAVPFDLERLTVTGSAVPILDHVRTESVGAAQFTLSAAGTLVYVAGTAADETRLVWVDRQGTAEPLPFPAAIYGMFRLSPDGQRLAVRVRNAGGVWDLWLHDLARETRERLTLEGDNHYPVWTPDGQRVTFYSFRYGQGHLFQKTVPGGEAELFLSRGFMAPYSWSPDGQRLALYELHPTRGADLGVVSMEGDREPQPLIQTGFNEIMPAFSPNGLFLAYANDESGQYEIYVQPYPPSGQPWKISTDGGENPLWSSDGTELFWLNRGKVMVASVTTKPSFTWGDPQLLFEGPFLSVSGLPYNVAPDGQRLLLIQSTEEGSTRSQLHAVTNWFEELKRLVPMNE